MASKPWTLKIRTRITFSEKVRVRKVARSETGRNTNAVAQQARGALEVVMVVKASVSVGPLVTLVQHGIRTWAQDCGKPLRSQRAAHGMERKRSKVQPKAPPPRGQPKCVAELGAKGPCSPVLMLPSMQARPSAPYRGRARSEHCATRTRQA